MSLHDLYKGRRTWSDYLKDQPVIRTLEKAVQEHFELRESPQGQISLSLAPDNYSVAFESGFGAIESSMMERDSEDGQNIDMDIERLAGGINELNADFNLLLGDLIWKVEMRHETLTGILDEIRLAEFEREARAYRSRAERAYLNGWYQEALDDFLAAEKLNYPDFSVLRSIAHIYLYHLIDLPQAFEYFLKAAKYALPCDGRQAAEAFYFAGVVSFIQKNLEAAKAHFEEAITIDPRLCEAHYQLACVAVLLENEEEVTSHLESAIEGDPRYYERARRDAAFDPLRKQVEELLEKLMKPVEEKLDEVRQGAKLKEGYVISKPVEEKISNLFRDIERRLAQAKTYRGSLEFLGALSQIQQQFKDIYHLFHRHYQIDLNDYVRSVAFSPDGELLAVGFLHGGVKMWEVDSGLNTLSLEGHMASVNSVAFSPDNQWLASGSRDKTIKLWDAESGRNVHTLHGHEGEVRAVAFSPDGSWLVSGSHDYTVRLWRVVTGREVQILGHHKLHVTATLFSHDGRLIFSSSVDKTVKVWDALTGRLVRTLIGHLKGVESLALSPDGRLLASGGEDRLVKIWDVATGRAIQTLPGHPNDVTSLAFSPDGKLLAAGSLGQSIRVWKLETERVIRTVRFKEISYNSVAFSPKGQWLALGSRDLQLWLKMVLTEEEYEDVKAGEERALLAKEMKEDYFTFSRELIDEK
jgi:WD40 repeat protein